MTTSREEPRFYWCRKHERVESGGHCGASRILGPYATPEDARNHAEIAAARNDVWDDEDDAWDRWPGERGDGGGSGR